MLLTGVSDKNDRVKEISKDFGKHWAEGVQVKYMNRYKPLVISSTNFRMRCMRTETEVSFDC